ncbi:Ferric reductase like transmembrane component [Ceratobasidium sp. AG-Ba]|nr:Ferric reductase like transmembrane component [Ceratobasidium sp. AG-Ba]
MAAPLSMDDHHYSWKETDPKYAYAFTAGWLSVAVALALLRLPSVARSVWKNCSRISPGLVLGIRARAEPPKPEDPACAITSTQRSRLSIWSSAVTAWLLYTPPWLKLDVGQCIVVASYLVLVAFCIFDHPDLKNHPNRPGFIAVAQFPILFLTAAKYNPLFAVLGRGHDKLNFLHRWAGRGVSLAVLIHAVLWVWRRFRTGLACRLYTWRADITGIAATIVLAVMVLLARSQVRRRCYELFFISHVIGTILFMVLIFFHAKWHFAAPWLLTPTFIYGLDLTLRSIRFRVKEATLEPVDDQMTLIHIQNCGSGWRAGQHVHVRLISPGGVSTESHSFSIVNAPPTPKGSRISVPATRSLFPTTPTSATPLVRRTNSDEDDLRARSVLTLAARVTGTWTRDLNLLALGGKHASRPVGASPAPSAPSIPSARTYLKSPIRVLVDGPYGAPPLPSGERVVLVCGGSGAAYIVGVLSDWLGGDVTRKEDEDEHLPLRSGVRSILLVWYIREARCVRWFADSLRHIGQLARARGVKVVLRICVTRERGQPLVSDDGTSSPSGAAKDYRLSTLSELDARQRSYLVASEDETGLLGLGLPGSIEFARPCIGDIIRQQVDSWGLPDLDLESDGGSSEAYEPIPDDDDGTESSAASLLAPTEERRGTGVSVVCCGPMPMVKETKTAVARLQVQQIRRAGGVWLHTEAYEL